MILENDKLKVAISTAGAELSSIFSKQNGQEFLWQGSADWWPRRAPVLFPTVGKLNKGLFQYEGKEYALPQHGFARDSEFIVESKSSNSVTFLLTSSEATRGKYPFEFELRIIYTLNDSTLETKYEIRNPSNSTLYFSIGAHPGFAFAPGESLTDYYIEFQNDETLDRHLLDEGLFNGTTERVVTDSKIMNLDNEMMKKDAVVFKGMKSTTLWLRSRRSDYSLKFDAAQFPYFGIWAKPAGPFVCLEPWCGLADTKGFDGDFKNKEGVESLNGNGIFTRKFSVTI